MTAFAIPTSLQESARAATIVSGTGYANSSFLGDLVQEVVISAVSFTITKLLFSSL
jgi:hypothetical protein